MKGRQLQSLGIELGVDQFGEHFLIEKNSKKRADNIKKIGGVDSEEGSLRP